MLRNVIEDYLTSIKEVQFFLPFHQLLEAKGFYDIHLTHGSLEYGKDFIAKFKENSSPTQYIFQIKAFDVALEKFRREVKPQLMDCLTNELSHPSYDNSLNRKVIFVTTGKLNSHASLDFQAFNGYIKRKLNEEKIVIWDKDNLVQDFGEFGIEPFFSLHNSPDKIGDFFKFYAGIKRNQAVDCWEIIKYTDSWLELDSNRIENKLQVFFETYLFSKIFFDQNRFYESVLIVTTLIRFLLKNGSYQEYRVTIEDYLKEIILSFTTYLEEYLSENDSLLHFTNSVFSVFYYPINCQRALELLSIYILTIDGNESKVKNLFFKIIDSEKGTSHPISDNYAVSIVLISLALIKLDEKNRLKIYLNDVTVWLCDRYENIGISSFGSDLEREFEHLLSEHLEGFSFNARKTSYAANCVLDICYMLGDEKLYNSISNDFKATKIILEFFHVSNDESLFSYDSPDILKEYDHEYSLIFTDDYTKIIEHERKSNSISLRDECLLYLTFLLRDRYFPTIICEFIENKNH